MRYCGVDERQQLFLSVRDIVHYVFGDINDLKNLGLLVVRDQSLLLDLNIPGENDDIGIFVVITLGFTDHFRPFYLFLVGADMVKRKNHLMELLYI